MLRNLKEIADDFAILSFIGTLIPEISNKFSTNLTDNIPRTFIGQ